MYFRIIIIIIEWLIDWLILNYLQTFYQLLKMCGI
jgi:hypothetical protein